MSRRDTNPLRGKAFRRLGQRIAELRRRRGISNQAELAHRLGWSPNTMSRMEAGTREIGWQELREIARELGTTVAQLLDEPEPTGAAVAPSLQPDVLDESLALLDKSHRLQAQALARIEQSRALLERLRPGTA